MDKEKAEDSLTDEEYLERFKLGNSEDYPYEELLKEVDYEESG